MISEGRSVVAVSVAECTPCHSVVFSDVIDASDSSLAAPYDWGAIAQEDAATL